MSRLPKESYSMRLVIPKEKRRSNSIIVDENYLMSSDSPFNSPSDPTGFHLKTLKFLAFLHASFTLSTNSSSALSFTPDFSKIQIHMEIFSPLYTSIN